MSFSTLGLSEPILKAVTDAGYVEPTAIQQKAIPVVLSGKNLVAAAQTGTGKTASFVLPLLEKIYTQHSEHTLRGKRVRALILTPTRELAVQVEASIALYAKYLNISSMAMYGGIEASDEDMEMWEIFRPHIYKYVRQNKIWFDPQSGKLLTECPFLEKIPKKTSSEQVKYTCGIYQDRPEDCRDYPSNITEMIKDECEMIEVTDLTSLKKHR